MFVIIKMQNDQLHIMQLIIKLPKLDTWAFSRCFVLSGFQTRGELTSHLLTALSRPLSFVFSCTDSFNLGLFSEPCVQKSAVWECCTVLNSVVTYRRGGVWALLRQNLPAVGEGPLAEQHSQRRQRPSNLLICMTFTDLRSHY